MAIAVQTTASTNIAAATSVTITKPTGTTSGDLLFAVIGYEEGGGGITVNSVPSGWTEIDNTIGSGAAVYTYYKVAGGSEGASYQWGISSSANVGGSILRIDGQGSSPIDQTNEATQGNDDTPSFATGITPTYANSLILIAAASKQNGTTAHSAPAITTSDPAGWTIVQGTSSGGTTVSVSYDQRAQTTSTGAWSLTSGNNSDATDTASQIISIVERVDVSSSVSALTSTFSIQAPTVVAGATVSVSALSQTFSIQTPTISTQSIEWTNESIPSASIWTEETP